MSLIFKKLNGPPPWKKVSFSRDADLATYDFNFMNLSNFQQKVNGGSYAPFTQEYIAPT